MAALKKKPNCVMDNRDGIRREWLRGRLKYIQGSEILFELQKLATGKVGVVSPLQSRTLKKVLIYVGDIAHVSNGVPEARKEPDQYVVDDIC